MIYFVIPLKSERVSSDWQHVTRIFNNTLNSLFNQTDPNFRILVVCHEIPHVENYADDPRLEIISVDFPPPIYRDEQMVDKHRKREVAGAHIRKAGGGYIMFVDADDLVSNRIVEFVRQDKSPNGYIIHQGYDFDFTEKTVKAAPNFDQISGTCSIVHFSVDDLPETPFDPAGSFLRQAINWRHPTWETQFAAIGRPLMPLPFRGAMYVWNTGENWTALMGKIGKRRQILRRFLPRRKITPDLAREFALEHELEQSSGTNPGMTPAPAAE